MRAFTSRTCAGLLALLAVLTWAGPLRAGDFFDFTATGQPSGTTLNATGSNIINLTNNLINEQQQFASLQGQNITADLRYGSIPNAVVFTENAAQTSATITFPTTGFSKTFTATSSSGLQSQVKDFIKTDAESAYAQFLQSVDRLSAVATLDGNPQASTAVIANDAFQRFGIENEMSQAPKGAGNGSDFVFDASGGVSRADGLNGNWADVSFGGALRFTDNVALALNTTVDFRNVGGSAAYTVAEEVGLPVTIIPNAGEGLSWQVTPWGFGGLSASYDQAAGTVLVGGGGTSSLAMQLGDFTLTLADQIDYANDVPVNVDGYGFDVNVNQWLVKNGVGVAYQPHDTPFVIDASMSYSNFLRPAAVPNFWTPSVGVGIKFDKYSGVRIGYTGDFAPRYNDNGGQVTFYLSF